MNTIITVFPGLLASPWIKGGFLLIALLVWAYMKSDILKRKFVHPALDLWDQYFNQYTIREATVQKIERDSNTDEIFVIVNNLNYELDSTLKYDTIMIDNINRGVSYYYVLPISIKEDWSKLKKHLNESGVSEENLNAKLKARFLNQRITSAVVYGLAIYIGREFYKCKKKSQRIIAVQYSKNYKNSFLIDTVNNAHLGKRMVDYLVELFQSSRSKFKSNHA